MSRKTIRAYLRLYLKNRRKIKFMNKGLTQFSFKEIMPAIVRSFYIYIDPLHSFSKQV